MKGDLGGIMYLKKGGLCIICLLFLCLVGCSSSNDVSYKKSGIHEDFPVPAKAKSSTVQFENIYIKTGEKYSLKNIGGKQGLYPPTDYLEEINNWGWEELTEERMGHVQFFRKGNTIISIVFKEDYFELFEMKEDFPLN